MIVHSGRRFGDDTAAGSHAGTVAAEQAGAGGTSDSMTKVVIIGVVVGTLTHFGIRILERWLHGKGDWNEN